MDRASQCIFEQYIEPTRQRNYGYIGMEFECPIFPDNPDTSLRELGSRFLSYLVEEKQYKVAEKGYDGCLVKVKTDGDSISFDLHYAVIEFSIKPCETLVEIKNRFNKYLEEAQDFYNANGCRIVGLGNYYPYKDSEDLTNLFPSKLKPEYTNDDFYAMVQRFYRDGLNFEKGLEYTINMCSTQTHLDIPFDNLVDTFNLINELSFVRGFLFSNSPWNSPEGIYYCSRDNAWQSCGVPNTGIFDRHFNSIEEICDEISKEKHFLKINDEGKPDFFEAVTLKEFFNDTDNKPGELAFFRCFKNVVINSYCCVEIREDCTQPFCDDMVTGAFNLGMALGFRKAMERLLEFKTKAKITETLNSELRKMSITDKLNIPEDLLKPFFTDLYEIAYNELKNRGFGEEEFLLPLKGRIERMECPAKVFLEKERRR